MSKIRIAALVATMTMAIPVFAQTDQTTQTTTTTTTTVQTAPPSAVQRDTYRAYSDAAAALNDPNVHWTIKEQKALLVEAPFVRPRDMWEMDHMFLTMPANDERVIFDAVTNTIKDNVGDYYTRQAAEEAYWNNLYSNPSSINTTVVTTPSGETAVTTTTSPTANTTPGTLITPPPVNTPATAYTPSGLQPDNTRMQSIGGGLFVYHGMSDYHAWEMLQRDLSASDRTTFRMLWDNMTDRQQMALLDIAKQSEYYYQTRGAGIYYNPYLAF